VVDSQRSEEDVVQVERQKPWTDAILASLKSSDHHVGDDEIFEILNAERDGEAGAALLAAKGVTVPMYCVWKAKYRNLTLDELRAARRRELWRARAIAAVVVAVIALASGGVVFALAMAANASFTIDNGSTTNRSDAASAPPLAVARIAATAEPVVDPDQGGQRRRRPAPSQNAEGQATPHPEPAPINEAGYRIQIAAANSLREGRLLIDRLAAAGYPGYILPATVGTTEVFRVRVGPFETREAAEGIAAQLRRDGFSGAWIAQ
jgi:cell division septation protein DedD